MDILSKFSERLKELVLISNKSVLEVCNMLNIETKTFYKWWSNSSIPNLNNLVLLANYFHCSIDFLIGRTDEENTFEFNTTLLPFDQLLKKHIENSNKSSYHLCKTAKIHKGSLDRWKTGKFVPLLDNLIKLADYFDCSIDYLVGRER